MSYDTKKLRQATKLLLEVQEDQEGDKGRLLEAVENLGTINMPYAINQYMEGSQVGDDLNVEFSYSVVEVQAGVFHDTPCSTHETLDEAVVEVVRLTLKDIINREL